MNSLARSLVGILLVPLAALGEPMKFRKCVDFLVVRDVDPDDDSDADDNDDLEGAGESFKEQGCHPCPRHRA